MVDINQEAQFHWVRMKVVNENIRPFYIGNASLPNLRNLEDIDLSNSGSLIVSRFNVLPALKALNISSCMIDNLESNQFDVNNTIEILDVSDNKIINWTAELSGNLTKLIYLDISGNLIESLDASGFDKMVKLEALHTNFLALEKLPIKNCQNLRNLTADFNNIHELRIGDFQGIPQLELLSLAANDMQQIEKHFFASFANLRFLNLSQNYLKDIDRLFVAPGSKSARQLEILDLSRNLIESLNFDTFRGLINLRELRLHVNKIQRIARATFTSFGNLEIIDLSHNPIEDLRKDTFLKLNKLKFLNLEYCNLKTIPDQSIPRNLQNFSLAHNELRSLPHDLFIHATDMRELDLRHNGIEVLSDHFLRTLSNLTELQLAHNQFSFLFGANVTFPRLRYISIEDNPWRCACLDDLKNQLNRQGVQYVIPGNDLDAWQCLNKEQKECLHSEKNVAENQMSAGVLDWASKVLG